MSCVHPDHHSSRSGHRRILRGLAAAGIICAVAGGAAPAWSDAGLERARYSADPIHDFGTFGDVTEKVSGDKLVTNLPPASAIDRDIGASVDIRYDPRVAPWYPPVICASTNYADGLVRMTYQSNSVSNGVRVISLTADEHKLKDLSEARTYVIRCDANGSDEVEWEIRPYQGPNYIASIGIQPGSPRPGDLVEFEISLSEPVSASGGQTIAWRLVPGGSFEGVRGGARYSGGDVNTVTIPAGQQITRLTVRVSSSARPGTATLQTWADDQADSYQEPYFQSRTFRIREPSRR